MEVVEAPQKLFEYDFDCSLVKVLSLLDEVDDGAALAILSNNLIALFALKDLVELYDVWVVHLLQQLQLSKHLILFALCQSILLYYFYRPFLPRLHANGPIHAPIRPFPNNFQESIIVLDALMS